MAVTLTNTSYALLGLLTTHEMSGYEIKAFADHTVRHFWAVSYGQIYPELRQLEQLGLVESYDAAVGGRRRTIYRPTKSGTEALEAWLAEPVEASMELRDELLLRLFFSDQGDPEDRKRLLGAIVKRHEDMARKLTDHRPQAARHGQTTKLEVLDFGVAFHEFCAAWFQQRLGKEG
jgi:DNA-binding PadR family transcriptional regulator